MSKRERSCRWKLSWVLWKNDMCDKYEPYDWINTIQDWWKYDKLGRLHAQVALYICNFYPLWRNQNWNSWMMHYGCGLSERQNGLWWVDPFLKEAHNPIPSWQMVMYSYAWSSKQNVDSVNASLFLALHFMNYLGRTNIYSDHAWSLSCYCKHRSCSRWWLSLSPVWRPGSWDLSNLPKWRQLASGGFGQALSPT